METYLRTKEDNQRLQLANQLYRLCATCIAHTPGMQYETCTPKNVYFVKGRSSVRLENVAPGILVIHTSTPRRGFCWVRQNVSSMFQVYYPTNHNDSVVLEQGLSKFLGTWEMIRKKF